MPSRRPLSEKRKEKEVNQTWNDFLQWTSGLNTVNWMFRGESSTKFKLVPKVGRSTSHRDGYSFVKEIKLLEDFQRLSHLHIEQNRAPDNIWDWLFLGQHYGLPTRLLDWSKNPFVAAFFATENESNSSDAVVHAIDFRWTIDYSSNPDPFYTQQVLRVFPRNSSQRMTAQSSIFTIHPEPNNPLTPIEGDRYKKFFVNKRIKKEFKNKLSNIGISRHSPFLNLEGVSDHVTFMNRVLNRKNMTYRLQEPDYDRHAESHIKNYPDPLDAIAAIEKNLIDCEIFGDAAGQRYCKALLPLLKMKISQYKK